MIKYGIIFLVGLVAFIIYDLFFKKKDQNEAKIDGDPQKVIDSLLHKNAELIIDATEDKPLGFGYKNMWIAVKTNDRDSLAKLLELKNVQETNWESGIKNAYQNAVFITPHIDEWTLAVGWGLPHGDSPDSIEEVKELLIKMSNEFDDVQFFCTHRVSEFHCWMKAADGAVIRVYANDGGGEGTIAVEGEPTDAERKYNLFNSLSDEAKQEDYYEREDIDYPDEEMVMEIAGKWSIDPTGIEERTDIKGLGLVGKR